MHLGPACPQTRSLRATHHRKPFIVICDNCALWCHRFQIGYGGCGIPSCRTPDAAFALPQVQPQASPYAQGWRVPLRYLPSRFPASGHATVPQEVSSLKSDPLPWKVRCFQPSPAQQVFNLPLDGARKCPMSQSQTFTSPSYEWMSNIVRQSISRAFAMRGSLMRQYSLWHMRSAGKSVGGSMKSKGDQHGTEHPSQQKIVKIHAPCIPPERVRYALHRWRDGLGPRE